MRRLITTGAVIGLAGGLALGTVGLAQGAPPTSVGGTYTYTDITGFSSETVGNKTVIEQTGEGTMSGTLTGTFEDEVTIEILPNGLARSRGTLTCTCTVAGKSGTLELAHVTAGEHDEQTFAGHATVRRATGQLSGMRGALELEGTLDEDRKATVTYVGELHEQP